MPVVLLGKRKGATEMETLNLARESLPVIVGLLVLLDVVGPLVTQRALMFAGESHPEES